MYTCVQDLHERGSGQAAQLRHDHPDPREDEEIDPDPSGHAEIYWIRETLQEKKIWTRKKKYMNVTSQLNLKTIMD